MGCLLVPKFLSVGASRAKALRTVEWHGLLHAASAPEQCAGSLGDCILPARCPETVEPCDPRGALCSQGVPLTHGNLAASLANIAATYELSPADRSLLVMPLFHVHGLMAGERF